MFSLKSATYTQLAASMMQLHELQQTQPIITQHPAGTDQCTVRTTVTQQQLPPPPAGSDWYPVWTLPPLPPLPAGTDQSTLRTLPPESSLSSSAHHFSDRQPEKRRSECCLKVTISS